MTANKLVAYGCLIIALTFCSSGGPHPVSSADTLAATNYYVDSVNGSDSNPGTSRSQPWRTIQKAANTMVAGDSTTVLSGNYNERVQITRPGTSGAPLTYQAEGTVTMKGFTVQADYITIVGFDISNTPDNSKDGWGIFVEGSHCDIEGNYVHYATRGGINIWAAPGNETETNHCTVRNNRLYRNAMDGIEVYGRDNLIEGNEVWGTIQYHPNWKNPPGWVDAGGINFFGSGHMIRKNYVHDIKYGIPENVNPHIDCFHTFGNSDHELAQNIVIEGNICKNVQAQTTGERGKGIMLQDANHILIRNNIIEAFNNININGDSDITIVNNVIASSLSLIMPFEMEGIAITNGPNTIVKNNIFYDLPNNIIYLHDNASKQGLDVGYNCIYRSDGNRPWGSPYPHDLWQVNPLFVNPGADDFHLQPNSPAVDAGQSLTSVTDDFAGIPRPQGAGYDIGAYELPVSRKTALPAAARINETVVFTINVAGNGNPATVTDVLPAQLAYVSSSTTCPGAVTYDSTLRQVAYSGTPQAGFPCAIQISTQVGTNQRMAVTNTARIDNSPTPLQVVSATVILNGVRTYLPMIFVSP